MSDIEHWQIEVCQACNWQVDDCDECGCADDENTGERVDVDVVPASQLQGAVAALGELDAQLAAVIALGDDGETLERLADLRAHLADVIGGQ